MKRLAGAIRAGRKRAGVSAGRASAIRAQPAERRKHGFFGDTLLDRFNDITIQPMAIKKRPIIKAPIYLIVFSFLQYIKLCAKVEISDKTAFKVAPQGR